ncbi:glycosyltransferase family 2 protein [Paracoccus pantotrophus]|uniref:glycosyltransferase n=2 Tax=Paracoccus pantotrophus TaxID=82367 RepID=UPI0009DDE47F|nr:glycosyltransferase family 2 protein [Paracoccus pantotrophus]RDD95664.1 glycosyltransferase family 2 protein [Paracoccus pantotrophus]WGR66158.1 glycosyltransferase family 2 protein [Paracoccus pantotrophus]
MSAGCCLLAERNIRNHRSCDANWRRVLMNSSCALLFDRQSRPPPGQVVIAIPVRDEAARIGSLLGALARAASRCPLPVTALVLANNCRDRTGAIARAFSCPPLRMEVHEIAFPDDQASAGRARRAAMELAVRDDALLMTTDGDAIPHPDWINAALRATAAGADLVCGAITARVDHVLATASGARITRVEGAYGTLVHEIRHCLDQMAGRQAATAPRPHYMESGASLAIRADAYRAIGGLPVVDAGEDRALVHRAETHGLRIRYADDMCVRVSARLHGRAQGGMADCLRQRMCDGDPFADQAMLPWDMLRRLWMRAMVDRPAGFPDRARVWGTRLRASDLEQGLPELDRFVSGTVRPDFARWVLKAGGKAA